MTALLTIGLALSGQPGFNRYFRVFWISHRLFSGSLLSCGKLRGQAPRIDQCDLAIVTYGICFYFDWLYFCYGRSRQP